MKYYGERFGLKGTKSGYVTSVKPVKQNKKFVKEITLADGTTMDFKSSDKISYARIKDIMEKQYQVYGLGNYDLINIKKNITAVTLGVTSLTTLGDFGNYFLFNNGDIRIVLPIGFICLGAAFASALGLKNYSDKKSELDKFKYRDANFETLQQYKKYRHALNGVRGASYFKSTNEDEAFAVIVGHKYTKGDLERIVDNIYQEQVFRDEREPEFPSAEQKKGKVRK